MSHQESIPTLPVVVLVLPNDGGLTLARTLIPRGVEVHAFTDERYGYVASSHGVRGRVMPDIAAQPQTWIDELRRFSRGGGAGPSAVLISGSDPATEFLTRYRADLPADLRTFEDAGGLHTRLMNKRELYRVAREAGVATPGMWDVRTEGDLDDVRDAVSYPCILKPTMGHLAKQSVGVGTVRCGDDRELVAAASALLRHGLEMIVTELVPGPETALQGAVTIRRPDGSYALEYGRHKIRQWPPDYGTGSLLESVDVPDMLALNRRLLDHVGFHGLSSCEAKKHEVTGELYLIEINVRMPANYGLSQACEVDGMWRLYAALANLPLDPQPAPVLGRKVMMHPDLLAAAAAVRRRPRDLFRILATWRGTRDFGVFNLRDLRPLAQLVRQEWQERRAAAPTEQTQAVAARHVRA